MDTLVELCDICHIPFQSSDTRIGHGDGRGQRFAHSDCYWRERAERAESRLTVAQAINKALLTVTQAISAEH